MRHLPVVTIALLLLCLPKSFALGQLGGSRVGAAGTANKVPQLPILNREVAEGFIMIDGRAEVRVQPTEIRVVLAVTNEKATAQECQQAIGQTIDRLKTAWARLDSPPADIVEDFIAVLPQYQWTLENKGDLEVGTEELSGYRMQTNIHLAVPNDAVAMAVVKAAFDVGVTDIIGFDYWSREIDDTKIKARASAVRAARGKADVLLEALFNERPRVINVQEQTTVRYPQSLYHSYERSVGNAVSPPWRREIPFIRAYRPQNTYYRGLFADGDVQARELPMRPEISVVSTVRLYYRSPAARKSTDD